MGDNIDWIDLVPRPQSLPKLCHSCDEMEEKREVKRFGGKTDFRFKNAIHFPPLFFPQPFRH